MSSWSPEQYEKFKAERAQPFWDLVALIDPRQHMRILDLGCGTGELTRLLHKQLLARETLGIDKSAAMLEKAPTTPGLHFQNAAIEEFDQKGFDLIFSNAALHWVQDHEPLFARLTGMLTRDGQLAVQMPANDDHPSHVTAAEVAKELGMEVKPVPLLSPERYAELLFILRLRRQQVRMQIYGHVLPSSEDVIEWVKGTLLTFYEGRDPRFMPLYRERLLQRIGNIKPYFYTYKRLLIQASF
ncbi:MAG: methyltransferase domain-containing protein [Acidobacteriota bacterium]|nr:methyltransferase domain-containing protein [Acidobacteriota bacterium]